MSLEINKSPATCRGQIGEVSNGGMSLGISEMSLIRQMRKHKKHISSEMGISFTISEFGFRVRRSKWPFYSKVTCAPQAPGRESRDRIVVTNMRDRGHIQNFRLSDRLSPSIEPGCGRASPPLIHPSPPHPQISSRLLSLSLLTSPPSVRTDPRRGCSVAP